MRFLSVKDPLLDYALAVFVPTLAGFSVALRGRAGGKGGGPLSALVSGRCGCAFSSVHRKLFRLEASQVKSSPARLCVRAVWGLGGLGGGGRLSLRHCRDQQARGSPGSGSASALAPDLTAFLTLSPSSCRRLGSDGGAGPAAVPLRHRDQPGAG